METLKGVIPNADGARRRQKDKDEKSLLNALVEKTCKEVMCSDVLLAFGHCGFLIHD